MAPLKNPRHEKFIQEIAKGKSQGEAYKDAGYDAEGHGAESAGNRLLKKEEVAARLAELQGMAAAAIDVTVQTLIAEAADIQAAALAANQHAAAVSALTAKAKLAGLWIDRKETGAPGEFSDLDSMSAEQLRAYVARPAPSPDDQDETRH